MMATGKVPERTGNRYSTLYHYDSFEAKDGQYVLGCETRNFGKNLLK